MQFEKPAFDRVERQFISFLRLGGIHHEVAWIVIGKHNYNLSPQMLRNSRICVDFSEDRYRKRLANIVAQQEPSGSFLPLLARSNAGRRSNRSDHRHNRARQAISNLTVHSAILMQRLLGHIVVL